MYFPGLERSTGKLDRLEFTPMQMRHFRLNRASDRDTAWLAEMLSREGAPLGNSATVTEDQRIMLSW